MNSDRSDTINHQAFSHEKIWMKFLVLEFVKPTFFETAGVIEKIKKLKDKGQLENCGCIMSENIGEYNTYPHKCVYFYANTSKPFAKKYHSNLLITNTEAISGF
jgi:hypothetical protein